MSKKEEYKPRRRPRHIELTDWCSTHYSYRRGPSCYETWGNPFAQGWCVFGKESEIPDES